MNGHEKSDGCVVPAKLSNKANQQGALAAEMVEERHSAKENSTQRNMLRTQGRDRMQQALSRVREAARRDRKMQFTTLLHHVCNMDTLREAYYGLSRQAAPGVDQVTWQHYGEKLGPKLEDLSNRLKRGTYRASPVQRVYIPKRDGQKRSLGVTALEDKIVQAAMTRVLNAIYEVDFLGFSYGFRPGRGQHDALDALVVGIERGRVNWVLDADIRAFFDEMSHEWVMKFIGHRIADQRILRLIHKWLKAGVLEDGKQHQSVKGTPQGGSASPLLANIYLHYVFDLWAHQWRKKQGRGNIRILRYADDIVMGFERKRDAECFLIKLRERFAQFDLELHPTKTRLIEFGRHAVSGGEEAR